MKQENGDTSMRDTPYPLRIEGEMTIYRAAELKETLMTALEHPAGLEIDLSGVTEIDSAGIQLLLLAKRSTTANQRPLRLIGHSSAVTDAFDLLNLVGYFGDPIVIPSLP
jgi:anti-sigma B factor antagonist